MPPEFSVIVPVRDGAGSLPALLRSLERQSLPRQRFEVIVVDNASRDQTGSVARKLGATVVHEPVANRSRARNAGAAQARGRRLAFVDADCVAAPDWLEALSACAGLAPLVAGAVRTTTRIHPNAIERYEALWRFDQASWVEQGWAATANLCVEKSAFAQLGGFDPAYRSIGEDADLCIRAARANLRLAYCAEAMVTHAAETRLVPLLRRSWRHGYSGNQTYHRISAGYRAWRRPGPALWGGRALALYEIPPASLNGREWLQMSALAQLSYAGRVLGSVYSELRRAR